MKKKIFKTEKPLKGQVLTDGSPVIVIGKINLKGYSGISSSNDSVNNSASIQ